MTELFKPGCTYPNCECTVAGCAAGGIDIDAAEIPRIEGNTFGCDYVAEGLRAKAEAMHPMVFLLSEGEGVLFDPQGRFHGWVMRRHPDGLWISVRKLEAVDPEASLPPFLSGAQS